MISFPRGDGGGGRVKIRGRLVTAVHIETIKCGKIEIVRGIFFILCTVALNVPRCSLFVFTFARKLQSLYRLIYASCFILRSVSYGYLTNVISSFYV